VLTLWKNFDKLGQSVQWNCEKVRAATGEKRLSSGKGTFELQLWRRCMWKCVSGKVRSAIFMGSGSERETLDIRLHLSTIN
jgi:hypothetical protein